MITCWAGYCFIMYHPELKNLLDVGCSPDTISHSIVVSKRALAIAKRTHIKVDCGLVRLGALLHDIGRSKTQGIGHAIIGADLAKSLGFFKPVIDIIEHHIGAGITASEAERLGLPKRDYLPLTPEEKIVSYADNLTSGVEHMSFSHAFDKLTNILGAKHEGLELFGKQHLEVLSWMR